ncbi:MAG: type I methionyl aminopeptidase [Thermomicrobiales bacterium]|nr:type I methionyl aminopeptidase [Thermomicrobiales bacterium]
MAITIKNAREIDAMRRAGLVVAKVHVAVEKAIEPGITTRDLDDIAKQIIRDEGATSSFLGHHGFTGRICASVNEEIVHGIPGKKRLKEGDIISVDVGAIVDGFHGDSAWTYAVGAIDEESRRLLDVTERSLYVGIAAARAGSRLGAIGEAVESLVTAEGYGMVREYGGHGIGRSMWEEPHVPNHGKASDGVRLRPGMTLAIEPMVNLGGDDTETLGDGWTVVTADRKRSAHFEHTVVITDGEAEILTPRLAVVV